ncbi:MAG: hypothetical protein OXR68_04560 [Alphaproteobacteria bacterium]|nr:hypothetical protein [Alphaproteobacteria bacterium]MDD9919880.1 hypothetical protein [Alphaproteobacteria bacterium]
MSETINIHKTFEYPENCAMFAGRIPNKLGNILLVAFNATQIPNGTELSSFEKIGKRDELQRPILVAIIEKLKTAKAWAKISGFCLTIRTYFPNMNENAPILKGSKWNNIRVGQSTLPFEYLITALMLVPPATGKELVYMWFEKLGLDLNVLDQLNLQEEIQAMQISMPKS